MGCATDLNLALQPGRPEISAALYQPVTSCTNSICQQKRSIFPGSHPRLEPEKIREDADVRAWFKAQGAGYQTRMNRRVTGLQESRQLTGGLEIPPRQRGERSLAVGGAEPTEAKAKEVLVLDSSTFIREARLDLTEVHRHSSITYTIGERGWLCRRSSRKNVSAT